MLTWTGAMRAGRGRPAPKWAAALAVVFALGGGGEAAAQLAPDNTFDGNGLKVDVAARVAEGTNATITVTARASVPAGTASATPVTVTVDVEPHGLHGATNETTDVILNPGTMTLTFPANTTGSAVTREVTGTIPLQTIHDPDAEDETIVLAVSASGDGFSIVPGSDPGEERRRPVTLDDDETQSYVLELASGASPREGMAFDVVVRADPAHVDDSKTLTLQIDGGAGYSLDTDDANDGAQLSGTLDVDRPSFTAKVTPPANDGNRTEDTVTVTAYSGTLGNAVEDASRSFTVADAHALPAPAAVVVEARNAAGRVVTSVSEGGAVELTVSVDRGRGAAAATAEALSVALALAPSDPAQASTYRISPARVDLPAVTSPNGKQSAATVVRLEALADEFVDDDRLMLNLVTTGEAAYGAGSVDSSFAIAVEDTTVKKIAPKSDAEVRQAFDGAQAAAAGADGLNPGEAFSVAVRDLFEGMAAGSTVVYSATSSEPAVRVSASSTEVTVTAVSPGSAAVRVNARVTAPSAAVPQTRSDEAAVEHIVMVTDVPLRVEITADPAATVEEGGAITLTAAANRAVLAGEDATVRLTVVGPVVEPAPSSVTIAVGATNAAAVLTVEDDDAVKDLGDVTVVATGGSLATDPTRLDIAVTENDVETVHTYTFTSTAPQVTEGGEVQLVVTAEPAVQEETVVNLTASPRSLAGDFTLEPSAITIAAGGTSGTAVLRAVDDDEAEDTETLTVTATGPGKVLVGTVEIMLVDNDTSTVVAKSQAEVDRAFDDAVAAAAGADGWTSGGRAAVLDARNLFVVAEGADVTYAALSSNSAVVTAAASATTVTLEPQAAGTAAIAVTATDSASGATATVSSGVTVSAAVVTYTLSGPADPNLVEGRSYELKVTASGAATTDATFTLRRDRAASDASDDDFTLVPASIVVTAGATEGTAVLTVADDGEDEPGEALVLFATTAGGDEVGSLAFTLWDASVPILPFVCQLLLGGLLAIGGYLRCRRR